MSKLTDNDFRNEYRANAELHAQQGLSEADYIRSRRIDEGLEFHSMLPRARAAAAGPTPGRMTTPRDREFEAEFDANPGVYAEMGLSKDQYVQSRQRDEAGGRVPYPPATN